MRHFDVVVEKAKKRWKDRIKGGLADKKDPNDFDKDELEEGRKVEREHAKDDNIAREIAMDHLSEDHKYYKKLKTIEKARGVTRPAMTDTRIGQTETGKTIFANHQNTAHAKFTPQDHKDAYLAHSRVISRSTDPAQIATHKMSLDHHFKMMNSEVQKAKRPEHKNWSKEDHATAMHKHHKQLMKHVSQMHENAKGKKGAMRRAGHKVLAKLIRHHAKEVHYHHTHSRGE